MSCGDRRFAREVLWRASVLSLGAVCVLALSVLVAAPAPVGAQPPGEPASVTVGAGPLSLGRHAQRALRFHGG